MIYDKIKQALETPLFLSLLKGGIIPLSILSYKVYYEMYLSEIKKGNKSEQSIQNICDEFGISKSTVNLARRTMTS